MCLNLSNIDGCYRNSSNIGKSKYSITLNMKMKKVHHLCASAITKYNP